MRLSIVQNLGLKSRGNSAKTAAWTTSHLTGKLEEHTHEDVYPAGIDLATCSLSIVRPIIRIEDRQALWVAYRIYRAPNGKYDVVSVALGRSKFGRFTNRMQIQRTVGQAGRSKYRRSVLSSRLLGHSF